jgi:hypothetical protein
METLLEESANNALKITKGLRNCLEHHDALFTPIRLVSDEAALYDRQIRLWGFDAQQRSDLDLLL